ncbi:helix-turn-helix domain-containing protein [Anaerotignum lactatifermentans]|uniref:Helix-turn-helix domain-containing protein n=1 Tax=Anaerotignum lactatifermentans TaxID=160404 RepID=A0ABS2G6S5_9FIRM|nr:helix-turn-helix domain-containing protein [Anaerotignum lactatifermentans]MBM6828994.1 helix-turn-helix domain-containing protein [Anaerotignum lactatifermentans]MBM6876832.1 helix-turn-helix domain-containing protein [Anaerotignum lactatifermentans]MBM6950391.1 helix-turn-helix domain-containing protein [Anaerotignum lactatifermentans]
MTQGSAKNDYFRMFHSYPDVVHVDELREMLGGIGRTTAYALLKSGRIESVKIGRVYLIPKINVIRFLYESEK